MTGNSARAPQVGHPRAVSLVTFLAVSILLTACGKKHIEWTEDLPLDDGGSILIERSITFQETSSWAGDASDSVETDARIRFTGALSALPEWRQPLMALAMYQDKVTKEWVIVASTTSCDVWRQRGKPKPSYWEFRLDHQAWREVKLSGTSVGRTSNLLFENRRLEASHVTADYKRRLQSPLTIARKYREIWGDPDMLTCGEGDSVE